MTYPHLNRAPIVEAVLDVAIAPVLEWRDDAFAAFSAAAQDEFPDAQPIMQFQAELTVDGTGAAAHSAAHEKLGYIYWNRDKTRAVQVRANGFSVNQVRSYQDWDALLAHAKAWWPRYLQSVGASRIARCGIRFINQFEITPGEDLSLTLRTRPELSSGLPQELDEYFQRMVVPFPGGARAAITQVIPPLDELSQKRMFVLDIDVSVAADMPASSDAMWSTFADLREIKNRCFFESLQKTKWEEFL